MEIKRVDKSIDDDARLDNVAPKPMGEGSGCEWVANRNVV